MERKGFIGGSDTVQIMQGNWQNLWLVKTGREEPEDLTNNLAVRMGAWTEHLNIEWFSAQNNAKVYNLQHSVEKNLQDVPLKGTLDGMVEDSIIECKHTNAFNTLDHVTEYYMPQVQTYIHLAEAPGAYLSVFFGNNKWESAYVSRNDKYFNSMMTLVSDFWLNYVMTDTPPDMNVPPANVSTDKIAINEMVKRDASEENEFVSLAHDFIEYEAASKSFESAKKDLKQMVGPNEREVYVPNLLAIKRSANGALRFTKLEKDQ